MWLRHSPLRSAHLLRVLLWGKEVGKGRELPSELVTNRKLQGWKFGQAKTLFQSHMTLGTSSRDPGGELTARSVAPEAPPLARGANARAAPSQAPPTSPPD